MTTTIIPPRQRGACPSLSTPMPTGDGLLARVNPLGGVISPADLAGIAEAAQLFGNGLLEVTLRGSLQIRGLRDDTVAGMNAAVEALGLKIRTGLPIDVAPLAGLCAEERADPRPLAQAIKAQTADFAANLGPKVSVVIDGGGPSMLHGVKADVRLTALDADTWQVAIAGDADTARFVGAYDAGRAVQSAVSLLQTIGEGGRKTRGRDLLATYQIVQPMKPREPESSRLHPGDILPLTDGRFACVVALPFGAIAAETLIALCVELQALGIAEVRLSPERILILLCADQAIAQSALARASTFDIITQPDDPRLRIVACAGAPSCASATYSTHALGKDLAANPPNWLDGRFVLHLSGCEKQCAQPGGSSIAVIGVPGSRKIVANGIVLPADFGDRLMTETHAAGFMTTDYIKSGDAIYEKSFAIIRAEADLSRFSEAEADVAVRMIHACGVVEAARFFEFSPSFVADARAALQAGAPILCDAEMVAHGVTRARLPATNPVICTLRDPRTPDLAKELGNTRSAAALELWRPQLEGAVVAIGNAPTALFYLLDMIAAGAPRPAAIIGMPVGFVGAMESKDALAESTLGIPFAVVRGRMGGSAMTAAAVNALARPGL